MLDATLRPSFEEIHNELIQIHLGKPKEETNEGEKGYEMLEVIEK